MRCDFTAAASKKLSELLAEHFPSMGKGKARRLITDKNVKVNGRRVSADVVVNKGETVEAFIPSAFAESEIDVVYEDENVVIADKPAHVDSVRALPKMLEERFGTLYPTHRLDTNTTGLVVLARGHKTRVEFEKAFKEHNVRKKYTATVIGCPKKKKGTLNGWLVKDAEKGEVRVYDTPVRGGVEAVTEYEVESSADGLTELTLYPLTGRTHQLRVQLAHIGCPILGDGKYGNFEENKRRGVKVQQLRAVSIRFVALGGIVNYLSGREFKEKENG